MNGESIGAPAPRARRRRGEEGGPALRRGTIPEVLIRGRCQRQCQRGRARPAVDGGLLGVRLPGVRAADSVDADAGSLAARPAVAAVLIVRAEVDATSRANREFTHGTTHAADARSTADASGAACASRPTDASGATRSAVDASVSGRPRAVLASRARHTEKREQQRYRAASHSLDSPNVSQVLISPLAYPRLNHFTRCAELPCVNDSGVT